MMKFRIDFCLYYWRFLAKIEFSDINLKNEMITHIKNIASAYDLIAYNIEL
jgi:hypothetical protein